MKKKTSNSLNYVFRIYGKYNQVKYKYGYSEDSTLGPENKRIKHHKNSYPELEIVAMIAGATKDHEERFKDYFKNSLCAATDSNYEGKREWFNSTPEIEEFLETISLKELQKLPVPQKVVTTKLNWIKKSAKLGTDIISKRKEFGYHRTKQAEKDVKYLVAKIFADADMRSFSKSDTVRLVGEHYKLTSKEQRLLAERLTFDYSKYSQNIQKFMKGTASFSAYKFLARLNDCSFSRPQLKAVSGLIPKKTMDYYNIIPDNSTLETRKELADSYKKEILDYLKKDFLENFKLVDKNGNKFLYTLDNLKDFYSTAAKELNCNLVPLLPKDMKNVSDKAFLRLLSSYFEIEGRKVPGQTEDYFIVNGAKADANWSTFCQKMGKL